MKEEKKFINILKVRDDNEPIKYSKNNDDSNNEFKLEEGCNVTWCPNCYLSSLDLRNRIEPWLTSLFQSEHLSLLVGSGLTSAIQSIAYGSADNGMNDFTPQSKYADEIIESAKSSATRLGRGKKPNIEDYIRVMNELLCGLRILKENDDAEELQNEINDAMKGLINRISEDERQIVMSEDEKRTEAFNKLVMFLMSFASRTGTRDRLNIFTTNYDRMIEAGADIAGIRLIDRFVGALAPIFRSSRLDIDMHYNPPGIRGEPRYLEGVAHFTKLHGSIDWIDDGNNIRKIYLPFGVNDIQPYLNAPGLNLDPSEVIIYPNSSKDRETAEYPYVELFRDFAAAICMPNSTLITYGFSFGDEHISRVIRDMLTIPSTHLVIISYDETERIMEAYNGWGHKSQISLMIGPDLANITPLVDYYLPKPSIDRATIRMSELLRQRYEQSDKAAKNDDGGENAE